MRKRRNPQYRQDLACVAFNLCSLSERLAAQPESIDWFFGELNTANHSTRMVLPAESLLRKHCWGHVFSATVNICRLS